MREQQPSLLCIILVVQMHAPGSTPLQLFIFPIVFQTVSFHHRASYELRLSFSPKPALLSPIGQLFAGEKKELIDRNGNGWNIDGSVSKQSHFRTNRFPIEYNDQIVKFKTGCLARLESREGEGRTLRVWLDLVKLQDEKGKGRGRRVSGELLEVSLDGGIGKNLRRVVFSTNQYISFVDISFELTPLAAPSLPAPNTLSELYQRTVLQRLHIYQQLRQKFSRKLQDFYLVKHSHPSFVHTYNVSPKFQAEFADREVTDLSYVAVSLPVSKQEDNAQSNIAMQRQEVDDPLSFPGAKAILCEHYQCQPQELPSFIEATGKLLEINILNLFIRLTQTTICLLGEDQHMITSSQITRIRLMIVESERLRQHDPKQIKEFAEDRIGAHKSQMNTFLKTLSSISGAQLKQPYVQVSNEQPLKPGTKLTMQNTLTVFIHGYKGNEYDLSKIKSHLMLLLGCGHFYSIKGINGEKAAEATIRTLAETAARELLTYLALSPTYRSINLIGFSLGGVIARAMLPWLQPHKMRLNLLLTIATPHLGLREIQNCLVRAGLCYLRRVSGIQAIRELNSERDASDSRFLLDLAKGEGLEWFRSIVLVGSFQDGYVPGYSSLVTYSGQDELTSQMAQRLSKAMGKAVRVAVRLEYRESMLDIITRRRTHISFLEEDSFIKYLLIRLQHLFAHQPHE